MRAMDKAKFPQWSAAFLAATPLVVSEHHYHIDPEQPRQPGALWAWTISGTSTSTFTGTESPL